ncbi:hypothetical protein [uncultured Ruegeria sp.]|uniref:hypothetical protein n=1 Tax=uncultured Ruegeria sp. TaxID=259304 RepID=UPI002613A8B4|nr:hypothetical protein [uncultured Ruegeria sp.]
MMVVVKCNEREEIRISRQPVDSKPHPGCDIVDFRVWSKTKNGFRPSNRGVMFDAGLLHNVLRALVDITNRAQVD